MTTRPPTLNALRPIPWTEAEPARLERDLRDVAEFDPALQYAAPGIQIRTAVLTGFNVPGALPAGQAAFPHGGWHGTLPLWPFDRPAPDGLEELTGAAGLEFRLTYPAAYPMVHPDIWPFSPEPEIVERTQATWHVLPSGGLCLLQTEGAWHPEASIVDLLLKAAGWRIEYALMKANVIDEMAVSGIVSDDTYDHQISRAADRLSVLKVQVPRENGPANDEHEPCPTGPGRPQ